MFKRILASFVVICFSATLITPYAKAANLPVILPVPGTMVNLSPAFEPALIKGMTIHKDNPFLFDFIVDTGKSNLSGDALKTEGDRLVKYFFACLTIPEKDLWVNLSPYEKDRMVPEALGQTALGRDLLAQDYILKQLTASLIYPEKDLGKEFWNRVYTKARQMYGTDVQVPVNTFNKVWIVADKASVFEHGQTAFIVDGHLKIMLEEDYLATSKNNDTTKNTIGSQILRDLILPEIEREVNTGKNFAMLRQIFYSQVLATWFKRNLKSALLSQVYANKSTVKGIDQNDKETNEAIYQQYLKAYKKGAFNYIKEDPSTSSGQAPIARKYFSGGYDSSKLGISQAMTVPAGTRLGNYAMKVALTTNTSSNAAMAQKFPRRIGSGVKAYLSDRTGPYLAVVEEYKPTVETQYYEIKFLEGPLKNKVSRKLYSDAELSDAAMGGEFESEPRRTNSRVKLYFDQVTQPSFGIIQRVERIGNEWRYKIYIYDGKGRGTEVFRLGPYVYDAAMSGVDFRRKGERVKFRIGKNKDFSYGEIIEVPTTGNRKYLISIYKGPEKGTQVRREREVLINAAMSTPTQPAAQDTAMNVREEAFPDYLLTLEQYYSGFDLEEGNIILKDGRTLQGLDAERKNLEKKRNALVWFMLQESPDQEVTSIVDTILLKVTPDLGDSQAYFERQELLKVANKLMEEIPSLARNEQTPSAAMTTESLREIAAPFIRGVRAALFDFRKDGENLIVEAIVAPESRSLLEAARPKDVSVNESRPRTVLKLIENAVMAKYLGMYESNELGIVEPEAEDPNVRLRLTFVPKTSAAMTAQTAVDRIGQENIIELAQEEFDRSGDQKRRLLAGLILKGQEKVLGLAEQVFKSAVLDEKGLLAALILKDENKYKKDVIEAAEMAYAKSPNKKVVLLAALILKDQEKYKNDVFRLAKDVYLNSANVEWTLLAAAILKDQDGLKEDVLTVAVRVFKTEYSNERQLWAGFILINQDAAMEAPVDEQARRIFKTLKGSDTRAANILGFFITKPSANSETRVKEEVAAARSAMQEYGRYINHSLESTEINKDTELGLSWVNGINGNVYTLIMNEDGFNRFYKLFARTAPSKEVEAFYDRYKGPDAAMSPGGIDLNADNIGMKITKDAQGGVQVSFDPAMIAEIKAKGIWSANPVIIQITPITPAQIRPLLGMAPQRQEERVQLAGV